jgi:hypothetical protein
MHPIGCPNQYSKHHGMHSSSHRAIVSTCQAWGDGNLDVRAATGEVHVTLLSTRSQKFGQHNIWGRQCINRFPILGVNQSVPTECPRVSQQSVPQSSSQPLMVSEPGLQPECGCLQPKGGGVRTRSPTRVWVSPTKGCVPKGMQLLNHSRPHPLLCYPHIATQPLR